MTSTNEPENPHPFRGSIDAIDAAHPLKSPWHYDQSITGPRLDRLDAKATYFVDYIEYLEHRIAALEAQIGKN
ncbi:hypothetical protein FHX49_000855 [Microbacterium endophyticum]|uniref:Uncharacterized protein n=1 Tax=Microbacterium endophyticum TaxID=1526412 RepID=A0A7W4V2E1_9MICO|nr:hypothetical protein [Microbacterium endophyticum]MBB2975289.1 hypothetical protein [Microbacterium endophyticum]NIK35692.1 hypothetical protein [Microbacterium endophyticum]